MGTMPALTVPSAAYQDSYLEALAEFQAEGRYRERDGAILARDFDAFVRELRGCADPATVAPGRVPDTILWLVEGDQYIGRVSIRHYLTDWLLHVGGHIGYEIRPSRRRQGYGTAILRLALPHARALGIRRALVTCDADNIGSKKIIEANGGRFENAVSEAGSPVKKLRYWIDLA